MFIYGQTTIKQLTTKEKIDDFNYLYQELKASYPYFGINKRVFNTDWIANKKQYLSQLKKTKNDIAFFKVLNGILNDLNNGHTDAYPTIIYNYFHKAYVYGASKDSIYRISLQELEKTDSIRSAYWKKINRDLFFPERKEKNTPLVEQAIKTKHQNVTTSFDNTTSTALVHIRSFSYDYVEQDADTLQHFFKKAHLYKNLIIDIQGNDGGSTEYWMENIVPFLIKDSIQYPLIYAFKNSKRLRKFKPNYFKNTILYEQINLPNMPKELKNGSYLFRNEQISIHSTTQKKYEGTIYLLVDNKVFSSSEALAYFCKATGFAIVAGEKTSGDGVGTDPLLITLPNSGIVIRFTGEMGLNPDGSANDETKTVPDVLIKASTKKERRHKLLKYILQKK